MRASSLVNPWMPVVGWMLLIFVGSTDVLSAEQTSRFLIPFLHWLDPKMSIVMILEIHTALRKLGHILEYAILAALLWRAVRGTLTSTRTITIAGLVFFASVLFAASDEFHQSFVPARTSSVHDVMIDACGVVIALALCWTFALRRKPKMVY
jgi:VanZ family protein